MANWTPESREEEILFATINGDEYNGLPESRIEELLLELKAVIEAGGGGGGGTTNYNALENKPQINGTTLSGNKSLADLGIIAEIKKVMDMITGQFDVTSDYSEGDIVIYDKKLYVFDEDHTAGEWDSTEVTQTTLEELIANAGGGSVKAFTKATPAMTSATTPSGVVSASSEYNGSYAAWYAFCGTPGNDQQTWATSYGHTTGEWIQYKFDEGVVIKKIATTNRNEGNPRVIRTFIFQGSDDGETYVDLANCEIESNQGHYRQEFLINNSTAYTYYRLYVTEPWVLNDTTVGLAQLEIYKEIEVNITELSDLVDVNIYNASEGQALIYDASSRQWVNTKVLSTSYGGTGNSSGYIRAGVRENTIVGNRATAEGVNNTVSGDNAHAEGQNNTASGTHSHAEGEQCQATEWWAHAEGFQSKAYGRVTHAEGNATTASNYYAHAEGFMSTASGNTSHAEGSSTTASGSNSHSQNENTIASGARSSAAGYYTNAGYENQFVIGKYNNNKSTSLFEVGNGTGALAKSNALELDTSGNLKVAGSYTDGNGNVLEPGEALTQAQMNSLLALIP